MQQSRGNREARLKLVLTDAVDNAPIIYKHRIILLLLIILLIIIGLIIIIIIILLLLL